MTTHYLERMKAMTIPFDELGKQSDSNSFVWVALTYNPAETNEIEMFLKEAGFLPADAAILDMRKISGNVLGDDGRSDVLFTTTPTTFNPLARLRIDGVKWTSDFIVNYADDYGITPVSIPEDDDEEQDAERFDGLE